MTKDEIIELAEKCGIQYRHMSDEFHTGYSDGVEIEQMQAFAKLVAAHTLMSIDPSKFISWQEGFEVGASQEREAIIDLVAMYGGPVDLEAAIRARGEA